MLHFLVAPPLVKTATLSGIPSRTHLGRHNVDWTESYHEPLPDDSRFALSGDDWPGDAPHPEVCPPPAEGLDPLDPLQTDPNWHDGGDGGGYPGGPTPRGFTDYGDGTGRFMYDNQGRLHVNPNYAQWLSAPDQRINWTGVVAELAWITGSSIGLLPFNGAVVLPSWMATWLITLLFGDEFLERYTGD